MGEGAQKEIKKGETETGKRFEDTRFKSPDHQRLFEILMADNRMFGSIGGRPVLEALKDAKETKEFGEFARELDELRAAGCSDEEIEKLSTLTTRVLATREALVKEIDEIRKKGSVSYEDKQVIDMLVSLASIQNIVSPELFPVILKDLGMHNTARAVENQKIEVEN
jgi:hypothetical protein